MAKVFAIKHTARIMQVVAINELTKPADGANAATREQFYKAAYELGKHAAAGDDSKANLAFKAVQGAMVGALDKVFRDEKGNAVKAGAGTDDAQRMWNAYMTAERKAAAHAPKEMTTGTIKKSVSQFRKFIDVGVLSADEKCDALKEFDRANDRIRELSKSTKCHAAYEAYYNVAVALGRAVEDGRSTLTQEELDAAIVREGSAPRTIADRISSVRGTVNNIKDDVDHDERIVRELEAAIEALDRALAIAKASQA